MKQVMSFVVLDITNAPGNVKEVKLSADEYSSIFFGRAAVPQSTAKVATLLENTSELAMNVIDNTDRGNTSVSLAMFPTDLTGKNIAITVTFESGETKTLKKTGINFERNRYYEMDFDAKEAVSLAKVGDYFYKDGTWSSTYTIGTSNPCIGIVYKVNADGVSGSIINTDKPETNWMGNKNREGILMWKSADITTNAKDDSNGLTNMATIQALDDDFSSFPAFAWLHGKNPAGTDYLTAATGVWYIPALEEAREFFRIYNSNVVFSNAIIAASGGAIQQTGFWTSSEYSTDFAWSVGLSNNGNQGFKGIKDNFVRCIRLF